MEYILWARKWSIIDYGFLGGNVFLSIFDLDTFIRSLINDKTLYWVSFSPFIGKEHLWQMIRQKTGAKNCGISRPWETVMFCNSFPFILEKRIEQCEESE